MKILKILLYGLIGLAIITALICLNLGQGVDPVYYAGFGLSAFMFLGAFMIDGKIKKIKLRRTLQKQWGRYVKRNRDFESIRMLFDYCGRDKAPGDGVIDDETWNDLLMNEVYARLDGTLSGPGEAVLYNILRRPLFSVEELTAREELIAAFQHSPRLREEIRELLSGLGRETSGNTVQLLWEEPPVRPFFVPLLTLMAAAPLASLATTALWGLKAVFLVILPVFLINTLLYSNLRKKYCYHIPSISYLAALVRTAQRIYGKNFSELDSWRHEAKAPLAAASRLLKKTRFLLRPGAPGSELEGLYEYLNVLFLLEARSFYGALDTIKASGRHLRKLFILVGTLDAMQAAASFRESLHGKYCRPEFTGREGMLAVDCIYHPLVKDCVPNSLALHHRSALITGSNMAGKSTFLRTVGVNALLAQSLNTCLAASYRGRFFEIITSIGKADKLGEGKSFYYMEAERLLKVVQAARGERHALCIVDELLTGTNSVERLAASEAILKYLNGKRVLALVATHDLELAQRLKGRYDCYHFTDRVDSRGLDFDYKLKKGVAATRNAIKLLAFLDYPKEIVEEANTISTQGDGSCGRDGSI